MNVTLVKKYNLCNYMLHIFIKCNVEWIPYSLNKQIFLTKNKRSKKIIKIVKKHSYLIGVDSVLDVLAELPLEGLWVLLFKGLHVIGDVLAKDMGAMDLRVEALSLVVVTRETLSGVRNVQATIDGSLHGAENSRSGRRAVKADVQVTPEYMSELAKEDNDRVVCGSFWRYQRHFIINSRRGIVDRLRHSA